MLENDEIIDSQDLGDDIESHIYSGTVTVKTISRWNGNGQGYTTYNHVFGISIYDVDVKQPYRIEVDIADASSGSVI